MGRNTLRPVRFGFDARLAGKRHAGIGRYSEQLLHEFLTKKTINIHDQKRPVTWVIFLSPDHDLEWLSSEKYPQVELHTTTIKHYSLAEQLLFPRELQQAELDILFVPHFNVPMLYRRPVVMTIHDLLWHKRQDARATTLSPLMHGIKHGFYRLISESAIKRALHIFVPSKVVAQEIAEITGRINGITITPEGVPEVYRNSATNHKRSTPKKERAPYLLYTGSLYPHKNVEVILRALKQLPQWKLRIASARSVFTDRLQRTAEDYGVSHQVEFLGYVPDKELIELYQQAVALIQPSTAEGFGLTGLEALAVECPVVASDIPIFHEVYGEYALYFSPFDALDLAKQCRKLAAQTPDGRAAQQYARQFTWEKMASRTWQQLELTLEKVL